MVAPDVACICILSACAAGKGVERQKMRVAFYNISFALNIVFLGNTRVFKDGSFIRRGILDGTIYIIK